MIAVDMLSDYGTYVKELMGEECVSVAGEFAGYDAGVP